MYHLMHQHSAPVTSDCEIATEGRYSYPQVAWNEANNHLGRRPKLPDYLRTSRRVRVAERAAQCHYLPLQVNKLIKSQ